MFGLGVHRVHCIPCTCCAPSFFTSGLGMQLTALHIFYFYTLYFILGAVLLLLHERPRHAADDAAPLLARNAWHFRGAFAVSVAWLLRRLSRGPSSADIQKVRVALVCDAGGHELGSRGPDSRDVPKVGNSSGDHADVSDRPQPDSWAATPRLRAAGIGRRRSRSVFKVLHVYKLSAVTATLGCGASPGQHTADGDLDERGQLGLDDTEHSQNSPPLLSEPG